MFIGIAKDKKFNWKQFGFIKANKINEIMPHTERRYDRRADENWLKEQKITTLKIRWNYEVNQIDAGFKF